MTARELLMTLSSANMRETSRIATGMVMADYGTAMALNMKAAFKLVNIMAVVYLQRPSDKSTMKETSFMVESRVKEGRRITSKEPSTSVNS